MKSIKNKIFKSIDGEFAIEKSISKVVKKEIREIIWDNITDFRSGLHLQIFKEVDPRRGWRILDL